MHKVFNKSYDLIWIEFYVVACEHIIFDMLTFFENMKTTRLRKLEQKKTHTHTHTFYRFTIESNNSHAESKHPQLTDFPSIILRKK